MPVKRIFLGWNSPCLISTAEYLAHRYDAAHALQMRDVTVVLPGGRAGRRLIEILVEAADTKGKVFIPPRVITVGSLPDVLVPSTLPQTNEIQSILLWIEVLRNADRLQLRKIIPAPPVSSALPGRDDLLSWCVLAEQFQAMYVELAGAGLSFIDVAEKCREFPDFSDDERWEVLQQLCLDYLERTVRAGYVDPQESCRKAIRDNQCYSKGDVVLVATVDLPLLLRDMLSQVASQVTALIHAPQSKEDSFDEYGCLVTQCWLREEIGLDEGSTVIVQGVEEQAEAALEFMASLDGKFCAEEITMGVGDEEIVPYLSQAMAEERLPAREAKGALVSRTGPAMLLQVITRYLASRQFVDFASVVRHVDLQKWLFAHFAASSDEHHPGEEFLSCLDHYHSSHLQAFVADRAVGRGVLSAQVEMIQQRINELFAELFGKPRPITDWAEVIVALLLKVYGGQLMDRNSPEERLRIEACEVFHHLLLEMMTVDPHTTPPISAEDALSFLLRQASQKTIPPEPKDEAIELLGWLELQLDDAPVLVVTGFNEGSVPRAVNADPFLPNSFRHHLGLLDNERRYARDAYALSAILASREYVYLIGGRRDSAGDPLMPSRLLFACSETDIAQRIQRFYKEEDLGYSRMDRIRRSSVSKSAFPVPPVPEPAEKPLDAMTVTAFRDYLRCPYRFYLKHVLGLKSLDDAVLEMDGGLFGALAHEVLKGFGESEFAASADSEEINVFLQGRLEQIFEEQFGQNTLPAVFVQLHQLKARLAAFAEFQAGWVGDGWGIQHVELDFPADEVRLDLGQHSMGLSGRIDRVDFNQRTGEWAVLDYKTGDYVDEPAKTHQRGDDWIDLQLPIYRYLLSARGITESAGMGYLLLVGDLKKTGVQWAEWTEEELEEAYDRMYEVARRVRAEDFWPRSEVMFRYDDFAAICGQGQFLIEESEEEY